MTSDKASDKNNQISILEAERDGWRRTFDEINTKKDLGANLFLIGSIAFVLLLFLPPIHLLILSTGLIVSGLILFIIAARKNKKAENAFTEISSQIFKLNQDD